MLRCGYRGFGSGETTIADERFDQAVVLSVLMQAGVGQPVERLSPTLATPSRWDPARSMSASITTVVPIPQFGLLTARSRMSALASWTPRTRTLIELTVPMAARRSTAIREDHRRCDVHAVGNDEHGAGDNERVLVVARTWPTSVAAPDSKAVTPTPSMFADLDAVTGADVLGMVEDLVVTSVPLVEPRSSTIQRSSCWKSWA